MNFSLRRYQQEASSACFNDLADNNKVCLVLPTGSGKTEIFIDITSKYIQQNPRKSVLILSHLSILTEQTKNRFKLRHPEIRVGILKYGDRPGIFDDVIIGTMQSSRHKERVEGIDNRLIKSIGLVIIDEAHFIQTQSYQKLLSYLPNAKVVGCTATPFRENKLMVNFFDKVSFTMSLAELIELGYLVPPRLIEMNRNSDSIEDAMAFVAHTYMKHEQGNKAIVFMRTIKEADKMRDVFIDLGINCESLTSKITGEQRDDRTQEFNNGNINILTSVDVLSIGFDSPPCSVIFQPFATSSVTKYVQRIGRGLRPHAESGKRDCRVYVHGAAPNIRRGLYQRLQNLALNVNGKRQEYDNYTDEWEFNEQFPKSERYEWDKLVVDTIKKFESLEMNVLGKLLNEKKFPQRFMDKINLVQERLPVKPIRIPHGSKPRTQGQADYLESFSFPDNVLTELTKYEAHMMIKTIKGPTKSAFNLPSGRYKDLHVAETPFAYRNYIVQNFPESDIGRLIRAYNERKKIA